MAEATAEVFRGGWYHTGDAGYLDEDGYLFLVDRVKDMIVTGGENVYSAEVESAISKHEAVEQVAVIGIPHETWGEQVHAIVVRTAGVEVTEDQIQGLWRLHRVAFRLMLEKRVDRGGPENIGAKGGCVPGLFLPCLLAFPTSSPVGTILESIAQKPIREQLGCRGTG